MNRRSAEPVPLFDRAAVGQLLRCPRSAEHCPEHNWQARQIGFRSCREMDVTPLFFLRGYIRLRERLLTSHDCPRGNRSLACVAPPNPVGFGFIHEPHSFVMGWIVSADTLNAREKIFGKNSVQIVNNSRRITSCIAT